MPTSYRGIAAGERLGATLDANGKSYLRLVLEPDYTIGGIDLGETLFSRDFTTGARAAYSALQGSELVVPLHPFSPTTGQETYALDVSLMAGGRSATAADLVRVAEEASRFSRVRSLERLTRDRVTSDVGPAERDKSEVAAAKERIDEQEQRQRALDPFRGVRDDVRGLGEYVKELLIILLIGLALYALLVQQGGAPRVW